MNWWNLLKVQQTLNVGGSPTKPVSEGAGITGLQQRATSSQQYQPAGNLTQPQQQNLNQQYNQPQQQPVQAQTYQITPTASGGEDSGTDDTDVGSIRQNVDAAKRNLSQLPRGPKAAELTEILNLISQASIDPVKQKDIAVEAKKKLHSIFPSSMA